MNLARFGLVKNEKRQIVPEGYELVDIPEKEALRSSARTYKYESMQELYDLTQTLGAHHAAIAQFQRDALFSRIAHDPNTPIPPRQKRKYVKHEKKTSKDFVKKTKKKLGLIDLPKSILKMAAEEVLELFSKDGDGKKLDKNLFARNVVWHFYRLILAGKPPDFSEQGCNIRTIFYVLKPILTANRIFTDNTEKTKKGKEKDDNDIASFYGNFSKAFQDMVIAGIVSYKDFNIVDDRKYFRFLPPARFNTHIILLGEKKAFVGRFMALASKYGTIGQITRGRSTILMTDTMLTEMFELGYDFSRSISILSFCDFDPVGTSIPYHFVKHLKMLGFYNINHFEQYGNKVMRRKTGERNGKPVYKKIEQRRPCLDIVNPHDFDSDTRSRMRHVLKASLRDNPSTADWAFITGGVTGTGKNTRYAISAEQFLPYVSEHLERKLKPLLLVPQEQVGLTTTLINLTRALQRHIGIRAVMEARKYHS